MLGGEQDIATQKTEVVSSSTAQYDTGPFGHDGVVEQPDIPWHVVVRLNMHGIAIRVDEEVVVKGNIAFRLKQCFCRIGVEKIAVDRVAVVGTSPIKGKVTHQQVGSGLMASRAISVFAKNIMANDRRERGGQVIRIHRSSTLVFDLQVISDGVKYEIVLNQSISRLRIWSKYPRPLGWRRAAGYVSLPV